MPIFSFQKGMGYAMSILRLVFGKVNGDFLFALYPMPALCKASEGGRYAPCDFTLLSEVKGIITSSPLQAAGLSNGVKDEREKI